MTTNYKKTGYPRGRPRKGEIRPPSPNAIACANYRARRLAVEPEWREVLNEYQSKWRASNLDRSRAQKRAANLRKKAWDNSPIRGLK